VVSKKKWLYYELMICDKYRGKNTGPQCVKWVAACRMPLEAVDYTSNSASLFVRGVPDFRCQRMLRVPVGTSYLANTFVIFYLLLYKYSLIYEGRLRSNAHSEISIKRDHVFKQMKVGSKLQCFSYKLSYLFFNIVAVSFNTFFPS
jgi:hypothetical protein